MAEKNYRVLVINPGSTSTKVGLFDGATEVFAENVAHSAERLAEFSGISAQMPYRRDTILAMLSAHDVDLATVAAFGIANATAIMIGKAIGAAAGCSPRPAAPTS